ncbi:MAG TPA: hypothetical protein VJ654_08970, partial [Noviherbaspirillum sp.]|nr:hypothetical protein [Noviherbaspirillum sp.]
SLGMEVLTFVSNIPNSDRCLPGGSSWITSLDYKTGGFVTGTDINYSGTFLGDALGSRAVLIKTKDGKFKALVRTSVADTLTKELPNKPLSSTTRRVAWRELPDQ